MNTMRKQPTQAQTHMKKYAQIFAQRISFILNAVSSKQLLCVTFLNLINHKKTTVNIEKKGNDTTKGAFCCQQTFAKYDLITKSNHT